MPQLIWDNPDRVPDGAMTVQLLGAYFGYHPCCSSAMIARMGGSNDTSMMLGLDEPFHLSGTGFVPCRVCEMVHSKETQIARINKFRLCPEPFTGDPNTRTSSDYEEHLNQLIRSGEVYLNYMRMIEEMLPVSQARNELLWKYTDIELTRARLVFDKISEVHKDERPKYAEQHAEVRTRCRVLGDIRYRLAKEMK